MKKLTFKSAARLLIQNATWGFSQFTHGPKSQPTTQYIIMLRIIPFDTGTLKMEVQMNSALYQRLYPPIPAATSANFWE